MPKHVEQRIIPHTPLQMYELVADVNRYREFLPWCMGSRVRKTTGNVIEADLIIGFKIYREKFGSKVELDREAMTIRTAYLDGPFRYLRNQWVFLPHEDGCIVDFYVDFEFKSKTLERILDSLFGEAVKRMVRAFESRADDLYGRSGIQSRPVPDASASS